MRWDIFCVDTDVICITSLEFQSDKIGCVVKSIGNEKDCHLTTTRLFLGPVDPRLAEGSLPIVWFQ